MNATNTKKIGIALAAVLILGFAGFKLLRNKTETAMTYVEHIVKKGSISVQILSTGVVQPENKVEIKPPIPGRIEKVLIMEGAVVKKGQVLAWMSSTERAAMLDAASAKGPQEVKDWEEMYRATPILAAINGTVIQKNVESGQTFTTQDAILVMSDRLTVKAQVDETDIAQIKLKQKAKITLDAYPEETIEAQVDQIAFDAKTVNNVTTYIVDVLPDVAPVYMRSGMTANVIFNVQSKNDIIVVPTESIKNIEGLSLVMTPNPNGVTEKPLEREVQLGLTDGKKTEIVSGLNVGDIILVQEFKVSDKKSGSSNPFSPMGAPRTRGGR
ncbi:MAG: efflux RND transporter periplasmic adaptor subunit [Bacteriovorax sp.]|nr:efflux RND transporter periplasmic adaptor subunit [Bacteriovorax sp.]